jgi:hypothetical protein
MTDEMMSLQALLEKSSDTDLRREMIGFAAHRLMELEVENLTGAARGERSAERLTHRNGYRDRDWETGAGTVELGIPKLRKGSYSLGPGPLSEAYARARGSRVMALRESRPVWTVRGDVIPIAFPAPRVGLRVRPSSAAHWHRPRQPQRL